MDFLRDGNNILVRCRDDGAGLDLAAIQRTAGERGIVAAERELPEEELKRLILRPNFSTRTTATQISGRGIGLDAVNSQVARLGGGLTIDSAPGAGCTFELRLPFTLISSHALLVRTGGACARVGEPRHRADSARRGWQAAALRIRTDLPFSPSASIEP